MPSSEVTTWLRSAQARQPSQDLALRCPPRAGPGGCPGGWRRARRRRPARRARRRRARPAWPRPRRRRGRCGGRRRAGSRCSCPEGWGDDLGGHGATPDVDGHRAPGSTSGRKEGQGDAVAEHRREVAAGDLADAASPSTSTDWSARGGRRPSSSRPRRRRVDARAPARPPAPPGPGSRPCPSHDPAETGLQRRDARAELVAVQRQAGLEAQRVAGAEPGRARCRRRATASHTAPARVGGHGELDAVLARVAGAGDHARRRPATSTVATAEPADRGRLRRDRGQPLAGLRALHGEDGPARR